MRPLTKEQIKERMKESKGFTLVELIVVLIILALLASVAMPALVGYIDKSKEQAALAEAHIILTGLQTLAITDGFDNAGNKVEGSRNNGYFAYVMPGSYAPDGGCDLSDKGVKEMSYLIGIDEAKVAHPNEYGNNGKQGLDGIKFTHIEILEFYYLSNGYKVTYDHGEFSVTKQE